MTNASPIFPLKSIVLPGGLFPLRIFERRYLDMVTKCIKHDDGFCISLVKKEAPDSYVTEIYEYGSWAVSYTHLTLPTNREV